MCGAHKHETAGRGGPTVFPREAGVRARSRGRGRMAPVESRAIGRDDAARLARLAECLPGPERALTTAVYVDGVSIRAAAAFFGVREWDVRRRLARLKARMCSEPFALAMRLAADGPDATGRVAWACFVEGLSIRGAAAKLNMPIAMVRAHRAMALAILDSARKNPRGTSPRRRSTHVQTGRVRTARRGISRGMNA